MGKVVLNWKYYRTCCYTFFDSKAFGFYFEISHFGMRKLDRQLGIGSSYSIHKITCQNIFVFEIII